MTSALVDLGSGFTLIKEEVTKALKGDIHTRRTAPCLQGISGSPLRILGAVCLEIGIGEEKVHKQWVSVVPNNYLSTDILLGCDVLGQSALMWNNVEKMIFWGNAPYPVQYISRTPGKVRKITQIPPPVKESAPTKNLHTIMEILIPPYQTQFVPLPVNETPGTTVILHPQGQVNRSKFPFCAVVSSENTIPCPFVNNSRSPKLSNQALCLECMKKAK